MALVDSAGLDVERLGQRVKLAAYGLKPSDLMELKRIFEHASTFGSLIQVPEALATKLPALRQLSEVTSHDLFVSEALKHVRSLVQQAELLASAVRRGGGEPAVYGEQVPHSCSQEVLKGPLQGV